LVSKDGRTEITEGVSEAKQLQFRHGTIRFDVTDNFNELAANLSSWLKFDFDLGAILKRDVKMSNQGSRARIVGSLLPVFFPFFFSFPSSLPSLPPFFSSFHFFSSFLPFFGEERGEGGSERGGGGGVPSSLRTCGRKKRSPPPSRSRGRKEGERGKGGREGRKALIRRMEGRQKCREGRKRESECKVGVTF
jgi:hypothetical protein